MKNVLKDLCRENNFPEHKHRCIAKEVLDYIYVGTVSNWDEQKGTYNTVKQYNPTQEQIENMVKAICEVCKAK